MALIYVTLAPIARKKEEDQKKQGKGKKEKSLLPIFFSFFLVFFLYILVGFQKKKRKYPVLSSCWFQKRPLVLVLSLLVDLEHFWE